MANDILKQIEQELKGEEVTQAVVEKSEPSVEEPREADKKAEVSGEEEPRERQQEKLSRRQAAAKESSEKIARLEKDLAERDKMYESRYKQLDELSPLAEELKRIKTEESKKKQQESFTTDPAETINQLVESKVKEYTEPYRKQIEDTNKRTFVDNSLNKMREWAGSDEVYNGVTSILPSFMENVKAQHGPEVAKYIAMNPEFLFRYLRDVYTEQNKTVQTTTSQENTKKKQNLAELNASISKPNQLNKETSSNKNNARKEIDNFLLNLSGQNRR